MSSLYVAVHRALAPPWGPLVDIVTRARFRKLARSHGFRWEFPDGPATHAFVVIRADDGPAYRVDAEPPRATVSAYRPTLPTRVWSCAGDVEAGIAAARASIGTPYDMTELGNQGAFLLREFGFPVHAAALEPARICTTLTAKIMRACGGITAAIGAEIEAGDAFPAEVARRCGALTEVDPVTLTPLPTTTRERHHARGCAMGAACDCGVAS